MLLLFFGGGGFYSSSYHIILLKENVFTTDLPKKPWRISTDPSPQRTDASTAGDATWPPFGARLPDLGNRWGRWALPKTSENYGMGTPKRS